MVSLGRGQSSSDEDPVLDVFFVRDDEKVDVVALAFRILDVSDDDKLETPVQVYPLPTGYYALDPTQKAPAGHKLKLGRFYAPWTVPATESLGLHRIEWEFQQNASAPVEYFSEDFYVEESVSAIGGENALDDDMYCSVDCVRCEGFSAPEYSDARVETKILLATRYIDKVTGRWFSARTFDENRPFYADGRESRTLHLEIPIIRLDRLFIENQGLLNVDPTEIDLDAVRVYNRHLSGQTQPDDRENPRISFLQTRFLRVVADGLFPPPRIFPLGRKNVIVYGVFGYTDPDPNEEFGRTPRLIQQVCCRLAARDLILDSLPCDKLEFKQRFRIVGDKEGTTNIKLQDLWLKGAFTGDPEIDNVLMMFKRPPRMAVV